MDDHTVLRAHVIAHPVERSHRHRQPLILSPGCSGVTAPEPARAALPAAEGMRDLVAMLGEFGSAIRRCVIDDEDSIAERARRGRWDRLLTVFPDLDRMSVLDLGGTAQHWLRAPVAPVSVHIVNIEPAPTDLPAWISVEQGDACALSSPLLGQHFDLVYSNSVIEHVGGHLQRRAFAEQVQRASSQHWVQTPYRYFPVEPHWLAPMMQFLPLAPRAAFGLHWPFGYVRPHNTRESVEEQMMIDLLDITQMRHYFPGDTLLFERFGPLVKSLVAVRAAD